MPLSLVTMSYKHTPVTPSGPYHQPLWDRHGTIAGFALRSPIQAATKLDVKEMTGSSTGNRLTH
ncbi:hypothetical protein J6590_040383 [Homalodisca vitripennis]|nr:hypothetical protein J6590_040383 [Homalodisca vitripennis]